MPLAKLSDVDGLCLSAFRAGWHLVHAGKRTRASVINALRTRAKRLGWDPDDLCLVRQISTHVDAGTKYAGFSDEEKERCEEWGVRV